MLACPICGSANTFAVAPFRHQTSIFAGCSRAACAECEMIFASPMPSSALLSDYNKNYFSNAHGGQPSSRSARAFFSAVAKLRVAYLKRILARRGVSVSVVLEIGPGPGYFAKAWKEANGNCTYMAVETDRSCHHALEVNGVELIDLPHQVPIDLVVMSHVLEHVPDPVNFIRQATAALKVGGMLFIEVPCQDWAHKKLDEPHVLFFDKVPMRRLMNDLGFVNVELGYFGRKIRELKSDSLFQTKWGVMRSKLIDWGLIGPFSKISPGMESLSLPLERASVAPYKPHEESEEPAWWLRVVAQKN
jgi:SAM-dependent methyltransferase